MNYISQIQSSTKKQLESLLENIQQEDLLIIKKYFDNAYYNSTSLIDDWKYDLIKDKSIDLSIGHPLHEKEVKVKLPYWLGSLDKIKPENQVELDRWISKFVSNSKKVCIMDKLDGISCLLCCNELGQISLYTRGDGEYGKDITYIKPYIKGIPINLKQKLYVRGELVIEKGVDGARNIVSGAVKSKKVSKNLYKVCFIAHELISSNSTCILEQLSCLEKFGFNVVSNQVINYSEISNKLDERKISSKFDIDGIVVYTLSTFTRNLDGNPDYAFAFKKDCFYDTKVLDVEWTVSKSRLLKPVVKIEPVNISGAIISNASGYNARYIISNKIGKNSIIKITRSGEVIPKIVDVITPSTDENMILPKQKYTWNENKVEFILSDENDDSAEVKAKKIHHFGKTLSIQYLGESTANKLVEVGIDSVEKLLLSDKKDFEKIENFKTLSIDRLYKNIHDMWSNSSLATKMHASGCFPDGIGIKSFNLFLSNPSLLNDTTKVAVNKYNTGYPIFTEFMKNINQDIVYNNNNNNKKVKINNNQNIVFTGFRDKELEKNIIENGGKVMTTISKNINLLVVNDDYKNKPSTKYQQAVNLNIDIITKSEFIKRLNISS